MSGLRLFTFRNSDGIAIKAELLIVYRVVLKSVQLSGFKATFLFFFNCEVMGLFDQILGAIDNPTQQANPDQLGSILGAVQQMSASQGVDPGTTQTVLSMVGGYVRSALQQQRSMGGNDRAEGILRQFGGFQPSAAAVQALFTPAQQQQISQAIAQRTGLPAGTVQMLLVAAVPLVLKLLSSGSRTQPGAGSNSVLDAFLDADGDGDVDVSDAIGMASQFFNR